jgi:hypothetical protein
MNLNVTQQQLDALERGQREAVLVRNERTRKEYALISKASFAKLQPLLRAVAQSQNGGSGENGKTWTEDKNARRFALINKQIDDKLTRSETRELELLQSELDRYLEHAAPRDNHILELILEGLQQRAKRKKNAG